jgi:hypothetical protein
MTASNLNFARDLIIFHPKIHFMQFVELLYLLGFQESTEAA